MGENKNDFNTKLIDLAEIVDKTQNVFPNSKSVILYEMSQNEFNYVKSNFQNVKVDQTQISIEISNTEIVFILENSYKIENKVEELVVEKPKQKKSRFFKRWFKKFNLIF